MLLKNKRIYSLIIIFVLGAFFTACGAQQADLPTPDPYEGKVEVNVGNSMEWLDLEEGVAVSGLDPSDFVSDGNLVSYTGTDYEAKQGIDVSFYQNDIDWEAVAASGVDFAMIRCGYRGSSEGGLFTDERFHENMEGATAAGLRVGVYFFSQALGVKEAHEEAQYVLELIEGYELSMPVAFDWEPLDDSRTGGDIDSTILTLSANVFSNELREAGYEPAVYVYRYTGYFSYNLSGLDDCVLWVGAPGVEPDFYYEHGIWQYSYTGAVPGIEGGVDLNLELVPR